jgi:hypothetical protein
MYPGYIPDSSNIPDLSGIYSGFIPDDIPNISGIPRLGGIK